MLVELNVGGGSCGMSLESELRLRIDSGTKKVIEEIAELNDASISEVTRNLIKQALDSYAGDRRLEIEQLKRTIESTEKSLDKLKDTWKKVTGEKWEE